MIYLNTRIFHKFFDEYFRTEMKQYSDLDSFDRDDIENFEYVHLIICPLYNNDEYWNHYHNVDYLINIDYINNTTHSFIGVDGSDDEVNALMKDCIDDCAKRVLIAIPLGFDWKDEMQFIFIYIDESSNKAQLCYFPSYLNIANINLHDLSSFNNVIKYLNDLYHDDIYSRLVDVRDKIINNL